MKAKITTYFKKNLSKIIPNSERLRYFFWLPKLNQFYKNKAKNSIHFKSRFEMYTYLNDKILENQPINYCEFGVYKGASIKKWLQLNTSSESVFNGFDTFTGLPEDWNNFTGGMEKGTFDVGGKLPEIDDLRVHFFKGIFQDTLPCFLKNFWDYRRLIINFDADLYSSTLYVLSKMNDMMKPGTIIIFDEFSSVLHEFRALEDFCLAFKREYDVLAVTESPYNFLAHIAIELK